MMNLLPVVALVALLPCGLHSKPNPLSGKHLRIGYIGGVGVETTQNEKNETIFTGPSMVYVDWLASRGSYTYTMVLIGTKGLNQQMREKNVNWTFGNFQITHANSKAVHYVYPMYFNDRLLLIPYPSSSPNIWSVTLPFTATVWFCFFFSMLSTVFFVHWLAQLKQVISKDSSSDSFVFLNAATIYVIGVATNQGGTCSSKARSTRLLAGTWCIAVLVFVNAYSGALYSYITAPVIKPLVNSLEDVANKSYPQIIVKGGVERSRLEANPMYGDNVLRYPRDSCGDNLADGEKHEFCTSLAKRGDHVYVMSFEWAMVLMDHEFRKTRKCELTFTGEKIPGSLGTSLVAFESSKELLETLNIHFMELVSYGFRERKLEATEGMARQCKNYKNNKQGLRKLALKDLSSAFLLLGFGCALSFIAFVYENLRKRLILCK